MSFVLEQPMVQEHRGKPWASSYAHNNLEKQRGDAKRAGAYGRGRVSMTECLRTNKATADHRPRRTAP